MTKRDNALMDAAFRGDIERARELLRGGANLDNPGDDGWTPLMWAAYRGHLDVVDLFLEAGANVNFSEADEGETVLMVALQQDDQARGAAVVRRLVAAGAQVDAIDSLGWTALTHAATTGKVCVVEALLAGRTLMLAGRAQLGRCVATRPSDGCSMRAREGSGMRPVGSDHLVGSAARSVGQGPRTNPVTTRPAYVSEHQG